jgi:simple sugar transport system substrate-binding protein
VRKTSLVLLVCLLGLFMLTSMASAKEYEIAVVVKIAGIPWFNRMEEGVVDAAKELGVNAYQIGPSEADPALQVNIIEDLIAKGVDAICVVPNDALVLEPVFKKARDRGIVVLTHESPDQRGADWDVETIDNYNFGVLNFEALAQYMGGEGEFAVFVGSLTVPLHNQWADVGLEYVKEKYPNMKLVTDRIPCGESTELSFQKTQELLRAYPNLKGIVGFGSLGPIGAAQALEQRNMAGQVSVVGTVIPSHAAPYLQKGFMQKGYLWDPADAGYAMVAVAKLMLDGVEIESGLELPRLGAVNVDKEAKLITCDATLEITAENADKLGF